MLHCVACLMQEEEEEETSWQVFLCKPLMFQLLSPIDPLGSHVVILLKNRETQNECTSELKRNCVYTFPYIRVINIIQHFVMADLLQV